MTAPYEPAAAKMASLMTELPVIWRLRALFRQRNKSYGTAMPTDPHTLPA